MKYTRYLILLAVAATISFTIYEYRRSADPIDMITERQFEIRPSGWSVTEFTSEAGRIARLTINNGESGFRLKNGYWESVIPSESTDSFVYDVVDSEHGILRVDFTPSSRIYQQRQNFQSGILSRKTWNILSEYHKEQFRFKIEQ